MHVLAPAATGVAPPVTTEASKTTFYLNTNKLNFTQAETACTALGGHLAAFIDKDEQVGGLQAGGTRWPAACCCSACMVCTWIVCWLLRQCAL